jgi:predicted transcriptional regulator of viral defense system
VGSRRDIQRRLFLRASRQGGYFTAAQAIDLGYSYQAQAHHVGAGNWQRVSRGLFRLTDWVEGEFDEFARWSLWSGGRAVVSHESALTVHQIGEFESPTVHLTVPRTFTMTDPELTLHRGDLDQADTTQGPGFRVTTPLRTVIDIAARKPDLDQFERLVADAVDRGMLTTRMLRERSEQVDPTAALWVERALNLRADR